MRNSLRYIVLMFLVAAFFSCDDDSIQQRLEKEKEQRLKYLNENDIPESARLNSGLYFIELKAGKEGAKDPSEYKFGSDQVQVYYTFYHLDGKFIDQKGLSGQFEPYTFTYGDYNIKPAITEAIGKMKVGAKARLIIPSSLNSGMPYVGIEVNQTNQFYTVICDLELDDVRSAQDPDSQF